MKTRKCLVNYKVYAQHTDKGYSTFTDTTILSSDDNDLVTESTIKKWGAYLRDYLKSKNKSMQQVGVDIISFIKLDD